MDISHQPHFRQVIQMIIGWADLFIWPYGLAVKFRTYQQSDRNKKEVNRFPAKSRGTCGE